MKAIKNEQTGQEFIVMDDQNKMLEVLKAAGVKIGRTSLLELLSGKREVVVGFKVVEVMEVVPDNNTGGDNGGQQDQGDQSQVNQNRREGDDKGDQGNENGDGQSQGGVNENGDQDNGAGGSTNRVPGHGEQGLASMDAEKQREIASEGGKHSHDNDNHPENRAPEPIPGNQGGTHEQHVNAGSQSHKGDNDQGDQSQGEDHPMRRADDKPQAAGDQQAAAPAAPKPAATNNGGATRKAFKSVEPKGKIKPVRSGTKIAKGLELMLKGTTQQELETTEGGVSDDVFDFVNRRVTKRGYGVKVEGDTIKLVLPQGTTKITYSNAAEGTAEEQAPAAKPIEEVKQESGDQGQGDQPAAEPKDEPADAEQQ